MRTEKAIKNSITSMIGNIISFFVSFIAQAIFIRILGAEFLGLNGLFTNILTMLSIFELGIGNAIVFNMYKPIAENNIPKIKSLMNFYKKAYRLIMSVIFLFGIILLPFLKYIVGDISVDINIYIVYILFLLMTVSSYIIAYKRNLIIANQENYIINLVHSIYIIAFNLAQLIIIYFTRNYYLYLVVKIICQLLENFIIGLIANHKYKYINVGETMPLDKETERDIFSRVKALIFHKVGTIIIFGSDNIIISTFFGIVQVGLYTNYYTIINAINTLFGQIISSATASVGNLIVKEKSEKLYSTFKKMRFLNSWISIFTSVSLLVMVQPFIKLWVGSEYLLGINVVIIIVFNYFQKMQRNAYSTFKDSAGIWREDKFVPLIESGLNIIFSIIFLKIFGIAGVFMGTVVSGLVLWCYSYPKFVYKKLFNRSYREYAKETIGYIVLYIIIAMITYGISIMFVVNNDLLQLLINSLICIVVPNVIMLLIFRKTENFEYFKELINKGINKITRKISKDEI